MKISYNWLSELAELVPAYRNWNVNLPTIAWAELV